jgi:uncharacterized protein (DUF342 family)
MKFTNNGSVTFGGEIESKGFFGKLISKIKGEDNGSLNGGFRTVLNYEQSLEITTGELAELFEKYQEYDEHTHTQKFEILSKLKKGLFDFEEELRERAAEAIPDWQEICHYARVKEWKQNDEYINLGKDEK